MKYGANFFVISCWVNFNMLTHNTHYRTTNHVCSRWWLIYPCWCVHRPCSTCIKCLKKPQSSIQEDEVSRPRWQWSHPIFRNWSQKGQPGDTRSNIQMVQVFLQPQKGTYEHLNITFVTNQRLLEDTTLQILDTPSVTVTVQANIFQLFHLNRHFRGGITGWWNLYTLQTKNC